MNAFRRLARSASARMSRNAHAAGRLAGLTAAIVLLAQLAVPAAAYDGEFFRVCRLNPYGDNYLSLRTCPSTRCREIFRMGPDTEVVAINPWPRRGWREIEILPGQPGEGLTGWAFGRYLCPTPRDW